MSAVRQLLPVIGLLVVIGMAGCMAARLSADEPAVPEWWNAVSVEAIEATACMELREVDRQVADTCREPHEPK